MTIAHSVKSSHTHSKTEFDDNDFNPLDHSEIMENQKKNNQLRLSNLGLEIADPINFNNANQNNSTNSSAGKVNDYSTINMEKQLRNDDDNLN